MDIGNLFRILSEPVRLRITVLLLDRELCVCDLMEVLQLPQSTISRHMARMKAAAMVRDRRDGKWVHYQLTVNPLLTELKGLLHRFCTAEEPHKSDLLSLRNHLKQDSCS